MAKPPRNLATVLARYDVEDKSEVSEFMAVVNVTPRTLLAIAKDADVAGISEYVEGRISSGSIRPFLPQTFAPLVSQISGSDPYYTLSRSAYSHSQAAIPSLGNFVHGATFESGLKSSFLSCVGITPVYWDAQPVPYSPAPGLGDKTTAQTTQYHSLATFYLMALGSPGGKYYHRRSVSYNQTDDQNFLINHGMEPKFRWF